MSRLPLLFVTTAAACLLLGTAMGIAMGVAHAFQYAPVHAHLNLLGWASLALMGLTYQAWPALATQRGLAIAQYGLSAGAALAFPCGIYLSIAAGQPGLAIAASLVWLAGVLLFLARLVLLLLRRPAAMQGAAMPLPAE